MIRNPFEITKAVDYTDEDINLYWVDYMDGEGAEDLMVPENPMPKIIIGNKGSGKTHIMKYFSYELQKIRHEKKVTDLNSEKYIGVYVRCSAFNAEKFSGKGVSEEMWGQLYAYYWELWVGERLTYVLEDLKKSGFLGSFDEEKFVLQVRKLFLKDELIKENSLIELKNTFLRLQKKVDYEVQNFLFKGDSKPQVEILIDTPSISYRYPDLLCKEIDFFKNKKILYLIDEMENFSELQQKLVQTLLRVKPLVCTYRIGARPYGIRTYSTLNNIEENREGSEFQIIDLDDYLRKKKNYEDYITKICKKRIDNSELNVPSGYDINDLIENQDETDIIRKVYDKEPSQSQSYLLKLKKNLEDNAKKFCLSSEQVVEIIDALKFEKDRVIERTNVFLFYKKIKKSSNKLVEVAHTIEADALEYFKQKNPNSAHGTFLEKFRVDVLDAIAREGRENIPYYGFTKLVDLSCHNPRTILRLLKSTYNAQYFIDGAPPLSENHRLSIQAQKVGIMETEKWFFDDNRISYENGVDAQEIVARLGSYLQKMRFSDLPPQCSIGLFTIDKSSMSERSKEVFKDLLKYSYIVRCNDRREKNDLSENSTYRLNSILLPKWELALGKRGSVDITGNDVNLFFEPSKRDEFILYSKNKMKKYNFPFSENKMKKNNFPCEKVIGTLTLDL